VDGTTCKKTVAVTIEGQQFPLNNNLTHNNAHSTIQYNTIKYKKIKYTSQNM
jgi:hypothetical protein